MIYETHRDNAFFINQGDCICAAHFHKAVEILYVIEGEKRLIINQEPVLLREGDLHLCMPYDVHVYPPSDGKQFCAVFTVEQCTEFFAATERVSLKNRRFEKSAFTQDLYAHLQLLDQRKNPVLLRGIINYILGSVLERGEFVPKQNAKRDAVREILEYVEEHFRENITLADTAAHFGYSKYHFSRLFHASFAFGFSAYVNQVRIYKSLPMLRTHKVSVVATECGFNSPQQYFLNFRKTMGVTPHEYLNEHKRGN